MVALKALSDPMFFLESNSTPAAIDLLRASSTLPPVLDDSERGSNEHCIFTGSLNGLAKHTVGQGQTQKLGGIIMTKNINVSQKLHPKVNYRYYYVTMLNSIIDRQN